MWVAVSVGGCALLALAGTSPWALGKGLAISSTAVPVAALIAAAMLWVRWRPAGLLLVAVAAGICVSNFLAYHDATLAPHDRMAELARIGGLVAGKGPTFVNDYEIYADRYFLGSGAPVEPAEYRSADLPTSRGILLTKTAYADLESFSLPTLLPYRSIVIRDSPVESRPPSVYRLIWRGRYYALYQRPARPAVTIVTQVPLGDQTAYPYCGNAENGPALALCSVAPASVPPCALVRGLGREAAAVGGRLVAYSQPDPIVVRADQLLWPAAWYHNAAAHTLTPDSPGTALAHVRITAARTFELWLGGSFARGFRVSVDGHHVGSVSNEIFDINGYALIARVRLSAGVHTIAITYPPADVWLPGSGNNNLTTLSAILLEPVRWPHAGMVRVPPARARSLCGRSLDWIEVVRPA